MQPLTHIWQCLYLFTSVPNPCSTSLPPTQPPPPSHPAPSARQSPYPLTQKTLLLILTTPGSTAGPCFSPFFGWWATTSMHVSSDLGNCHLLIHEGGYYRCFSARVHYHCIVLSPISTFIHSFGCDFHFSPTSASSNFDRHSTMSITGHRHIRHVNHSSTRTPTSIPHDIVQASWIHYSTRTRARHCATCASDLPEKGIFTTPFTVFLNITLLPCKMNPLYEHLFLFGFIYSH